MSTSSRQTNAIYFHNFCWNCWKRSSFFWDCCQGDRSLELPAGLSWTTPVGEEASTEKARERGEEGERQASSDGVLRALDQRCPGLDEMSRCLQLRPIPALPPHKPNSSHAFANLGGSLLTSSLHLWFFLGTLHSLLRSLLPWASHAGAPTCPQTPQLSQGPGLSKNSLPSACSSPRQPHSTSF